MLMLLAAAVTLPCEQLPTVREQNACANARQAFVCWTTESQHIRDTDPALLLFWNRDEGESINDAKIDLAIERVNGCEPKAGAKR